MPLTATATQGFERLGHVGPDDVLHVPGDPGDAITKGDQLVMAADEGVLDIATDSEVGICAARETVTMAASSVGFPVPSEYDAASDTTNTLVAVHPHAIVGAPIYKCTFANHHDDTLAAYTAATPSITLTVSPGANDDTNGGLIYCHAGTGAGQIGIGADYDHASLVLTMHRKFETAVSTDTEVIILEGEGGGVGGIGFFGRMDLDDNNALDASDGYDDGDWVIYLDFRDAARYLSTLTLPVIPAVALL